MKPVDGGCAVDVAGIDGYTVVAESVYEVYKRLQNAMPVIDYRVPPIPNDPHQLWVELTVLADPDAEIPRRPTWIRADHIVGLTYISPEHVEITENEI